MHIPFINPDCYKVTLTNPNSPCYAQNPLEFMHYLSSPASQCLNYRNLPPKTRCWMERARGYPTWDPPGSPAQFTQLTK